MKKSRIWLAQWWLICWCVTASLGCATRSVLPGTPAVASSRPFVVLLSAPISQAERDGLKQEFSLALTSCVATNAYAENLTSDQESRLKGRAGVVLQSASHEIETSRAIIKPRYLQVPDAGERDLRRELSLGAYRFDPKVSVPWLPEKFCVDPPIGEAWYVVQLDRSLSKSETDQLKLHLNQPLSGFGFLERLTLEKADKLRLDHRIRYIDFLQPGYKIDPNLEAENGKVLGQVWLWRGKGDVDICSVSALSAEIRSGLTVVELQGIAKMDGIFIVERAGVPSLRSYTTSWTIQSNVRGKRPLLDKNILGQDQVVGIIDADIQPNHDALKGNKVLSYEPHQKSRPGTYHGTRVAVLLAGKDASNDSTSNLNGQAPEASLRFTWWEELKKDPKEFTKILENQYISEKDYDLGARIFSNSWGDNTTDSYTSWARQADDFSWNHEHALIVFSINEVASPDGTTKVKSPENAKNVLAVGASKKPMEEGKIGSGGEGPTRDDRRKPDMFVPGCEMLLAKLGTSDVEKVAGCFTSWASPVAAGAAALVRQYFKKGWYPSGDGSDTPLEPSGALLKAMLLNASVDMDQVAGYPNNQEGWGRLQLNRSVYIKSAQPDLHRRTIVWDVLSKQGAEGVGGGEKVEYEFTVPKDSSEELRVTLVWTDRPGCLSFDKVLINDLDLILELPDGKTLRGDELNKNDKVDDNVEQIIIKPKNGKYKVTVYGASVPAGKQGFALVVSEPVEG